MMAPAKSALFAIFLALLSACLAAQKDTNSLDAPTFRPAGPNFRKQLPHLFDILTESAHFIPLQHKHTKYLVNASNPWISRVGNPSQGLPHIVTPAFVAAMQKMGSSHSADVESEEGQRSGVSGRKLLANVTAGSNATNVTLGDVDAVTLNGTLEVNGLYWMRLLVGTQKNPALPSQYADVDIDTGSDLLWFRCDPCTQCTSPSLDLPFSLNASSTLTTPPCTACQEFRRAYLYACPTSSCASECTPPGNYSCNANATYGDGSSFTGRMYRDIISFKKESGATAKAPIYFACDLIEDGNLVGDPDTNGLVGLGQNQYSFPSQMFAANQTGTADVFSTCLAGMEGGGGIVFGADTKAPLNMSSTPMGTDPTFYNATMTAVLVDGKALTGIPARSFYDPTSFQPDAIFDTGASAVNLNKYIFLALFTALDKSAASQTPRLATYSIGQRSCYGIPASTYSTASSLDAKLYFPTITFAFQGVKGRPAANLTLSPDDYIIFSSTTSVRPPIPEKVLACPSFYPSPDGTTLLGDPALRNHYFTFNRTSRIISFAPYNCTTYGLRTTTAPVNITQVLTAPQKGP